MEAGGKDKRRLLVRIGHLCLKGGKNLDCDEVVGHYGTVKCAGERRMRGGHAYFLDHQLTHARYVVHNIVKRMLIIGRHWRGGLMSGGKY
eukprot:XP_001710165.1 Hypothetical protein GL50803_38351 [Giardia lamblia ATCC 50803]